MIVITSHLFLDDSEIKITFIRSPGPGGQNVNKLATAAQLRFNVLHSTSLPEAIRMRFLTSLGNKITREGDLIIRAHRYRSQERNKQDAIDRLIALLKRVAIPPKKRKKTKTTKAASEKRLAKKKIHGRIKSLRSNKFSTND